MVLKGRKAQFFLIILVFMIIIIVGLAYYAVESTGLAAETAAPRERGVAMLTQIESQMKGALEQKPYTGNNVSDYYTTFETQATRKGFTLGIDCTETNSSDGGYPSFDLNCNLNLSWETANLSVSFSYSYTVPFKIRTYSDENYTIEADYYLIDDTVYYRITGNETHKVNLSATHKGVQEYTDNHTLPSHYDTGDFVVDDAGAWQLKITNYNTSETKTHIIHVQELELDLEMEGNGSGWHPRTEFIPGEWLRMKVTVRDVTGQTRDNVPLMITVTRNDGSGTATYFDTEGTSGANNTEGEFISFPIKISSYEEQGYLLVTVTELRYYSSNTTTIQILGSEYPHLNPLTPVYMEYNNKSDETFGALCGYDEWFNSSNQSYFNGSVNLPFYAHNQTTTNNIVSVDGNSWVVTMPQVHASRIHIVGARHNPSEE